MTVWMIRYDLSNRINTARTSRRSSSDNMTQKPVAYACTWPYFKQVL